MRQSVPDAIQHWELTVGRGAEYILNLPPSKAGVIGPREANAAAVLISLAKNGRLGGATSRSSPPVLFLNEGPGPPYLRRLTSSLA